MVGGELHTRLRENDPAFFEQAVLDLLIAMGYGRSLGKATRTQLSNDDGIDGVIDQDALHGAQANQGVFLTTSTFTPGAQQYADSVQLRVVLIDGALLTRLMIRHGVGTQIQRTINIVEIDEDFFE